MVCLWTMGLVVCLWTKIVGMFVEQDLWYVCGLGLVVCLWTRIGGMFVN